MSMDDIFNVNTGQKKKKKGKVKTIDTPYGSFEV